MNTDVFAFITARPFYSGSTILPSAITTNLPFSIHAEFPGCDEAANGTDAAYQEWLGSDFAIILTYDGTTSLADEASSTDLQIKM